MNNKIISLNDSIYNLIKTYPEIKEIMLKLGFENIANETMLHSVGHFMTLNKGSQLKKIDIDLIIGEFKQQGFIFKEETNNE